MNLVSLETPATLPRPHKRLTPRVREAMQRTMSLVPSAMPLLYGGGDPFEYWQPTGVAGFVLDLNPHFKLTSGLDGARVTVSSLVNNAPSASDSFTNSNPSLQPTYEPTGWGGTYRRQSFVGNGLSYYLICSTSLPATLASGTDTPFTLFWAGQHLSTAGTQVHLGFFRTSSNNPIWDVFSSAGVYASFRRDNAATTDPPSPQGGTPDTNKHVYAAVFTGTTLTMFVDGVAIFTASSQNVGAITFDVMCLLATYGNSSPANWAAVRLGQVLGFTGALASQDVTDINSVMMAKFL